MENEDRQAALAFGRAVRSARQAKGLSLAALAAASGVSRAMLSEVERGTKSPTLPVASRIARGLGLGLSRLLGGEAPARAFIVTRKADRLRFQDAQSGMVRELLSPALDGPGVEIARHVIPAGAASGPLDAYPAGTRKFVVVERGRLALSAGAAEAVLEAGDAAYFEAEVPHSFANAGRGECSYLLVISRGRG